MLLSDIKAKAESLLKDAGEQVKRDTQVYDASKNYVIVSGVTLDGVVSSVLSADVIMNHESGIDSTYQMVYENVDTKTLTITLLPTANANSILKHLAKRQKDLKGWCKIVVVDNGETVNIFRGVLMQGAEITSQAESADRQYTFAVTNLSLD